MFIKEITIEDFRGLNNFVINDINAPNREQGSGLTVFVGENGTGKSTLLEAFALAIACPPGVKEGFGVRNFSHENRGNIKIFLTSPEGQQKDINIIAGEIKDSPDFRTDVVKIQDAGYPEKFVLFLDAARQFQISINESNTDGRASLVEKMNTWYFQYYGHHDQRVNNDTGHRALSRAGKMFGGISPWRVKANGGSIFFIDKRDEKFYSLSNLGSGYQIIFHYLYFLSLAREIECGFVAIIDEPELHMHPALQAQLVDILLESSKDSQIILATHSPLLVKQFMQRGNLNDNAVRVLCKGERGIVRKVKKEDYVLSYISANEINYVAFNLATEEYHNELYEGLKVRWEKRCPWRRWSLKDFDNAYFVGANREARASPDWGDLNEVSIHTFIRNQIHHRADNGAPDYGSLKSSIEKMRKFWQWSYPTPK